MQPISFTRMVRGVLVAIVANGAPALSLLPVLCGAETIPADTSAIGPHRANLRAPSEETAIRPFRIEISEKLLVDLRRRIAATKWPERESVIDATGTLSGTGCC